MTLHTRIQCWLAARGATAKYDLVQYVGAPNPVVENWVSTVPRPALSDLPDDATVAVWLAAQADAAKDAAAELATSDVRLRAAAAEIVAEIEKIKLAVRTLHPAAASALPERTAAEWEAAIKARAKAMQQ